jgi:osmotically-inducible protein OsmY
MAVLQPDEMLATVQAALERCAEVNLHDSQVRLVAQDARLVMSGEVPDIVAKRAAHLTAVRLLGADRVLDELCVKPIVQRSDAEIAAFLEDMLIQERAFRNYPLSVVAGTERSPAVSDAAPVSEEIAMSVSDAVVTLEGTVGSLTHRRLADVLAWWTPGVRGVRNFLHVVPEQADNDAELCDALRIVLEKDPSVDADSVGIQVKDRVVTLQGTVSTEEQRWMALRDAWYILGVHGVDNRLQVR